MGEGVQKGNAPGWVPVDAPAWNIARRAQLRLWRPGWSERWDFDPDLGNRPRAPCGGGACRKLCFLGRIGATKDFAGGLSERACRPGWMRFFGLRAHP